MPSWKFDAGPRCVSSVNFDSSNFYIGADTGLWIANIDSENIFSWDLLNNTLECTSVWSNNKYVYYGTVSGIYYLTVSDLDGEQHGTLYKSYPDLLDSSVKYINGKENILFVATTSGLNLIYTDLDVISTKVQLNVFKTWICSDGSLYYSISGTQDKLVYHNSSDLNTITTVYTCTSGDFSDIPNINDFYITEGTSEDGVSNTIFIACSGGAFVFDQGSEEYDHYVLLEG